MATPPGHPRRCGEQCFSLNVVPSNRGSSPRVRGTLARLSSPQGELRFISAGVWSTQRVMLSTRFGAVHPRRCGEHSPQRRRARLNCGSSPQVRGTRREIVPLLISFRFIPAGAGNTLFRAIAALTYSVHPRRCGEHSVCSITAHISNGSSPQVRGTRSRASDVNLFLSVHPRRCGEHLEERLEHFEVDGSSPQVRGTRHDNTATTLQFRFIPAGAGNTANRQISGRALIGSSPQVRGTHYL